MIEVTGDTELHLSRIDIASVSLETNPASITTGIPCGMTDMCGQDPCLCGAVDEYGACACNGTEETFPSFTLVESDVNNVCIVELFGKAYFVPISAGEADVRVSVSLPHYETTETTMHVVVEPLGVFDVAKVAGVLLACAVLVWLVVRGVRAAVKMFRVKHSRG